MDNLASTPTVNYVRPDPKAASIFGGWLRQREFMLRALVLLANLSMGLAIILAGLLLLQLKKRTQLVFMDGAGNVSLIRGTSFAEANELHLETAKLATSALLSKGPKDFIFAELLPQLFSVHTQALAEQLRQNELSLFGQRQMRQIPEIASVDAQALYPASVAIKVVGQLVRSGFWEGQTSIEAVPFTLQLTLVPNPDLLRIGRYPLIVTAFTLTYEASRP